MVIYIRRRGWLSIFVQWVFEMLTHLKIFGNSRNLLTLSSVGYYLQTESVWGGGHILNIVFNSSPQLLTKNTPDEVQTGVDSFEKNLLPPNKPDWPKTVFFVYIIR